MTAKRKVISPDTQLRMRAEAQIRYDQGKVENGQTVSADLKLLHELLVYKIELEIQNEELRLAQEKAQDTAQDTAEKYTLLYDFAPVGYFMIDRKYCINELNLHGARMLGKERPKLLNSDIRFFISEDTRPVFIDFLSRTFETKTKQTCEVNMTTDSNTMINVLLESTSLDNNQCCLIITVDITERKQIEENLRVSENKFKKAFHQSPCLIGLSDIDTGEYLEVNQTFYDVLGFTPNDVIGKRAADLFPFYHNERGAIIDRLKKAGFLHNIETTINKKGGAEVNLLVSFEFLKIGNKRCLFTSGFDITEQKRATQIKHQTRQNYETFFNTIDQFLFVLDEKGNIIHFNTIVPDQLGYSSEELIGLPVLMIHPEERRDEAERIIKEMLLGKPVFCTVPLITKSGIQIPVETKVSQGMWNGKPVLFGASKNISQILLSEEKFSKAFYLNPAICSLNELKTEKYTEVNDAFCNILGLSKEEIIGKTSLELGILTPSSRKFLESEANANGKISNVEVELKTKNGETKQVLVNSENFCINDREYLLLIASDITERKRVENMLITSQERLMALSDASFEAIFLSENGIIRDMNQTAISLFGYTSQESIGLNGIQWIVPEDREIVAKNINANNWKPYEVTAQRKDGTTFPAELQGRMINYRGRNMRVTAVRDISKRKQAEAERTESELRLMRLAEQSQIITWEVDDRGLFTYISPVIKKILGYHPDELVGKKHFYDLHPEKGREAFKEETFKVFQRKEPFKDLENTMQDSLGRQKWVSTIGIPVFNPDGSLKGYQGSDRSINERKEMEKKAKLKANEIKRHQKKLKLLNAMLVEAEEKEQARLAEFLHDGLGQILAITNIQLTTLLLDKRLAPDVEKTIRQSSKSLSEAIRQCRVETYELNPPILKEYGLIPALKWKIRQIEENNLISMTLETANESLILNHPASILLYRIIGELINNALKHAKPANIKIKIVDKGKRIFFSVIDDGIGFDYKANQINLQNQGFGLFSINERMRSMSGKLKIVTSPGKGTTVQVIFPVL
jgi:PAS domain S-box-containing protein